MQLYRLVRTKYTVLHFVDISSSSSVYTCKLDSDCHGNGYCKNEFDIALKRVVGKCMCLPQYKYEQDCSEYACKYNHWFLIAWFAYNIKRSYSSIFEYLISDCITSSTLILNFIYSHKVFDHYWRKCWWIFKNFWNDRFGHQKW